MPTPQKVTHMEHTLPGQTRGSKRRPRLMVHRSGGKAAEKRPAPTAQGQRVLPAPSTVPGGVQPQQVRLVRRASGNYTMLAPSTVPPVPKKP